MSYSTVFPIWNALRDRFSKMASGLSEEELELAIGQISVRSLLLHTAEVEIMFAEWFFGKANNNIHLEATTLVEILQLLNQSNQHIQQAMEELDSSMWQIPIESPMGSSTPLEAIGRLMYHAGIHAGQISLIRKQ